MLTYQTQHQLAELLFTLASSERTVENLRRSLCENPDFEPYHCFKAIDTYQQGFLTKFDLQSFCRRNSLFPSDNELCQMVGSYDQNNDGRLTLTDFYQLTLPSTSIGLRQSVLSRPQLIRMRPSVEADLTRLIDREIQLHRNLENLKVQLQSQYDFTINQAFKTIDSIGHNYIDAFQLQQFLRNQGYTIFQDDLDAILRRLDNNGDGVLDYNEFLQLMSFSNSARHSYSPSPKFSYRTSSPLRRSISPRQSISPTRSSTQYQFRPQSPSIREARAASPLRSKRSALYSPSPTKFAPRYSSPERSSMSSSSSYLSRYRPRMAISFYDEADIAGILQEQIQLDRDIEIAKEDLAQRADFNLEDSFRILDLADKGYVTLIELEEALRDLGVQVTSDEVYLLVKHYNEVGDSRLRYSGFIEMISPKDEHLQRILNARTPVRVFGDRNSAFSIDTLNFFTEVLRRIVNQEVQSESLRQRMDRKPGFNLYDAFQAIDKDRNGFITYDEFAQLVSRNGWYATGKDLENLMERYDKNRDGLVSYSDFVQEITPKSPRRY